jgi:hypothetical protein
MLQPARPFLDKHICLAKTPSKSSLRSLPLGALDDLLQTNDRIRRRYDEAVRREFIERRGELIDTFRRKPVSRLASFFFLVSFLALSQLNTHEGRDTNLIVDSLTCGIVSSCLGLDLDSLGRALVELERKHLIEATPLGLRLINLTGLEDLAKERSDRSVGQDHAKGAKVMSIGGILVIILILFLLGGFSGRFGGYGHGGIGVLGTILIVV